MKPTFIISFVAQTIHDIILCLFANKLLLGPSNRGIVEAF